MALADPFDQGLPGGELLSRGWWGIDRQGIASLVQPAYVVIWILWADAMSVASRTVMTK